MADDNPSDLTTEKQIKNTSDKPWLWKPGQSGNPAGRPPKGYSITETIKEMMDAQPEIKKALSKVILQKALEDKDMTAIKLLWSYLDGMPKLTQEISGPEGEPIIIIRDGSKTE